MTIEKLADVEFGEELPVFDPDTSLDNVKKFAIAAGWNGPRFTDHEAARDEGLPGALVPGIMSQGFLAAMIHRWAPDAEVQVVDTVFRAPVIAVSGSAIPDPMPMRPWQGPWLLRPADRGSSPLPAPIMAVRRVRWPCLPIAFRNMRKRWPG